MDHFYCRVCDRAVEFQSQTAAEGEGWVEVTVVGRSGPITIEYEGLCPRCRT